MAVPPEPSTMETIPRMTALIVRTVVAVHFPALVLALAMLPVLFILFALFVRSVPLSP